MVSMTKKGSKVSAKADMTSRADVSHLEHTSMCSFYAVGKCLRGENCKFAHSLSQIRQKPDLTRTSLCHDWMRKRSCKNGDKCRYAHGEKELNQRYESQEPLAWDPLGLNEGLSSSIHAARERPSTLYPLMEKLIATRPKIQKPSKIPRTLQLQPPFIHEDEALETFNTFNTLRDLSYLSPRSCGGIPLGGPGIPGVLPDFRDLSRREKVHFRALDRYLSSVKAPMAPSDPCKVVMQKNGHITCALDSALPKTLEFPMHINTDFIRCFSEPV